MKYRNWGGKYFDIDKLIHDLEAFDSWLLNFPIPLVGDSATSKARSLKPFEFIEHLKENKKFMTTRKELQKGV